jgi:hypothetical protein
MKKLLVLLIIGIAILSIANPAFSQDSSTGKDYKFTIKTNPLSALGGPFWVIVVPVTGEYKVFFEAAVSNKSSIQIGAGLLGPSVLVNLDDLSSEEGGISGIKTSGFRFQGFYKIFLSRDLNAPEGFYIGPHVSYANATIKNKDNPDDKLVGNKLNIHGVIGYQLITSGGFTLDVYTGMGMVNRKWDISGTDFDSDAFKTKTTVSIPFGVSIGYAF